MSLPPLPPHLQRLLDAEYPRFSDTEMARRRAAMEAVLAEAGCDHLVFYGANRAGSSVQWLTQWPVTTEAVGVLSPGKPDALFLQYVNHPPLARKLADKAEIVEWGGESSIRKAIAALEKRGARENKVGVIGPMNFDAHTALAGRFGKVTNLNRAYVKLRRVKSAEELDWFRIGAWLSDRGMAGLRAAIKPGVSERELADAVERGYVGLGGTTGIHFIGTTPMRDPQVAAPSQFHSSRRVETGDIVFSEITATFWDHSGQVLRSFTVGEEPTPLYRDLHQGGGRRVRRHRRGAAARRDAGAGDRGVRCDRGGGFHRHRRHPARLRRRLFPADPRHQEPARCASAGGAVRGRHDGGGAAERDDPRRQGRRADRRMPADHEGRHRANARLSKRI